MSDAMEAAKQKARDMTKGTGIFLDPIITAAIVEYEAKKDETLKIEMTDAKQMSDGLSPLEQELLEVLEEVAKAQKNMYGDCISTHMWFSDYSKNIIDVISKAKGQIK